MKDDGIKYEEFCCKYLQEKGYSTKTTVASGDQGADIIASRDGIKLAVQCKYRTEGSVGNDAVQQALAGMHYYDCHTAIVMTNVDFTPKAKSAAQKMHVILWPNIKMVTNDEVREVESDCEDKLPDKYVSNFLWSVISKLSIIEEQMIYGRALSNSRFPIALDEDDFDLRVVNSHEEHYLKGKSYAEEYLNLFNGISGCKFVVIDWFFSSDSDKNIFLYKSSKAINTEMNNKIRNTLETSLSQDVSVDYVTDNVLAVSIVNLNKCKPNSNNQLIDFITDYIKANITPSIISINPSDEIIKFQSVSNYSLTIDGEDVTEEYGMYNLFSCAESISKEQLASLKTEANDYFRRRVAVARVDDHRFICAIKKLKGMNDYLSLIDVNTYFNHDYTDFFTISTGLCDNFLEFTVRLYKINISNYENQLKDYKYRAAILAPLEQIHYFITGIINLILIDSIKTGKICISLHQDENGIMVAGLNARGIRVKAVDVDNRIVYVDTTECSGNEDFLDFPITCSHYSFIGDYKLDSHYIGLDVMIIQKMIKDVPYIKELLNDEFVIDILKDKINEYISILNEYNEVFEEAYNKLASGQTNENSVFDYDLWDDFEHYMFSYNIRRDDAFLYSKYEYDHTRDILENYYIWKLLNKQSISNLLWGNSENDGIILEQQNDEIKKIIEESLSEKNIPFKYLHNKTSSTKTYIYELDEEVDLSSALIVMNEKTNSVNHSFSDCLIYGFRRADGQYAFMYDDSLGAACWREKEYVPLNNLIVQKNTPDYSYWFLDSSLTKYCDLYSEQDSNTALLSICLRDVSASALSQAISNDLVEHDLWSIWLDIVLALNSLMSFLSNYYTTRDDNEEFNDIYPYRNSYINLDIAIYDKNNILLALLSETEIHYSYFFQEYLSSQGRLRFQNTNFNDFLENYRRDIIPIINNTLLQRIKALECLGKLKK